MPATTPAFDLHLSWSNQTYWLLAVSVQFYNPKFSVSSLNLYQNGSVQGFIPEDIVDATSPPSVCARTLARACMSQRPRIRTLGLAKHYIYITGTRGGEESRQQFLGNLCRGNFATVKAGPRNSI